MSDTTPIQTVLQQRDARPVAGEHLEVLGKKAAANWGTGKFASLNEAVVDLVRDERLSPEQVRRVVEFTNGAASGTGTVLASGATAGAGAGRGG